MKIVKTDEVTGNGVRGFINIEAETTEDAYYLATGFNGEIGNGDISITDGKVYGYFDPEYVTEWLNICLFMEQLDAKDIRKLTKCLSSLG